MAASVDLDDAADKERHLGLLGGVDDESRDQRGLHRVRRALDVAEGLADGIGRLQEEVVELLRQVEVVAAAERMCLGILSGSEEDPCLGREPQALVRVEVGHLQVVEEGRRGRSLSEVDHIGLGHDVARSR